MAKIPSPCIGVCKYKRDDHCIGCSMNKDQKKIFKTLKKARMQQAFIKMLCAQQEAFGGYGHWEKAYDRKCRKWMLEPIVETWIGSCLKVTAKHPGKFLMDLTTLDTKVFGQLVTVGGSDIARAGKRLS